MALHEDKMGVARLYTVSRAPYFSSIIYGFIFTPFEGIRTMLVTPGMILGYDPRWAERATIEELGADIYHECHHFCRRHFWRKGAAYPELFNIAGDFAINPDLVRGGWKLAEDAIFPNRGQFKFPEGLTTEEYYDLLLKQKLGGEGGGKKENGADGKGDESPASNGKTTNGGQEPTEGGQGQGQDQGGEKGAQEQAQGGVCSGHCGGIAGNPSEIEKLLESVPDLSPRTEVEIQAIEIRAAKEIKEWTAKQAGRGTTPSFLSEFLKAVEEEPVVSWQDELTQVTHDCVGLIQSGGDDYSIKRPSKRTYTRGLIRPGLIEHQPEVAVILDTSGSMGKKNLLDAVREVRGIMEAIGIDEVWFCEADAGVAQAWQRVDLDFFRELKISGRGGTDFRPALKSVEELHPVPDLVIYLTDGDGTPPSRPPPFEVVWGIVDSHWNKVPSTWGHTVFITDDKRKKREFAKAAAAQTPALMDDYTEYDDADDIG